MGIGGAKYILVAVDAYSRFLHVMPMRRKAQAASLFAQLFERVRVQVIRKQNNGVRKLHTDKGGEFMSRDLESFVLGAESCTHFQTVLHISQMV